MNRLRWIFELVDRVSGPATKAAASVNRFTGSMSRASATMNKATATTNRANGVWADANGRLRDVRGRFIAMGDAGLTSSKRAQSGMSGLIDKVKGLAAAYLGVRTAAFVAMGIVEEMSRRDSQARGLRVITGSTAEANRIMARSADLAGMLGQNVGAVRQQIQGLMGSGIGEEQAFRLTQAFADLSSLTPDLPIENLQRALVQMRGKGRVMAEELRGQFLEPAGAAGITQSALFEQIAPMLNVRPDQVNDAMQQGRILPEMFETAFLRVVANMAQRGGGAGMVGEMAAEASQGFGGQLRRLQDAPARIFTAMADEGSVAGQKMTALMARLNGLLDPSTPAGQEMISKLVDGLIMLIDFVPMAVTAFGVLWTAISSGMDSVMAGMAAAGITDLWTTITEAVSAVVTPLTQASGGFSILSMVLKAVGFSLGLVVRWWSIQLHVIGWVIEKLMSVVQWFAGLPAALQAAGAAVNLAIDKLFQAAETKAREFVQQFSGIGEMIVNGFVAGIRMMMPNATAAITELGSGAVSALRNLLGIHSPSRVFMALGAHTAEGFALGVEDGRQTMITPPTIGAMGGGPGAGGAFGAAGANISIVVNVSGGSDAQETGEAIGDALAARLLGLWDGFALEAGA